MIIIAAVDDRNGMMFNHRRQSQDKVLREKILSLTAGKVLWMDHYSAKQFYGYTVPQLNIDDCFMWEAAHGEYCFVEDVSVSHFEKMPNRSFSLNGTGSIPAISISILMCKNQIGN